MKLDINVSSECSNSIRSQQLGAMFEVPMQEKLSVSIQGNLPIEDKDWSVGLIVGPSGCGKSLTLNNLFGSPLDLQWSSSALIDNFSLDQSMEDIVNALKSVGFNTIPAWLRPYSVLSNGERFRSDIARRLLDTPPTETIRIDEFTSVVDRQVARIVSHETQKFIRQNQRKLVVASCHYDIVDWLQPDWIFEPASSCFTWRLLRGRPKLECSVARVKYDAWKVFAPFHYMNSELHRSARCFGCFVDGQMVAMCALLFRPHAIATNIMGFSRMVCLPDWQGMGLALALAKRVASAYSALGFIVHTYPNHPAWARSYQRQLMDWQCVKPLGVVSSRKSKTSAGGLGEFGGKRCAVFKYIGQPMEL